MPPYDVLAEMETYLDELDLAIEGKSDWPTPMKLYEINITNSDPKTRARLKALINRNEEVLAKVEQRKKDLSLLMGRISKRDSAGPIVVDIRA